MKYRVDNIPWYGKPLFLLYGYGVGLFLFFSYTFLYVTCRIRYEGREEAEAMPQAILAVWHQYATLYFICFLKHTKPHLWLNHSAAYMKPIHVLLRLVGVEGVILGSTGNQGREAADRLVTKLKEGYSTAMLPDGPYGPPHILKKGILHIAAQSGVPVVPIRFEMSRYFIWPSWDGKRIPVPFSKVRVVFGKPIFVTYDNFEEKADEISRALGD